MGIMPPGAGMPTPSHWISMDGHVRSLAISAAIRNGLRVVEVASIEQERIHGEGKLMAFSAGWTILKAMIHERLRQHNKKEAQVLSSFIER